MLEMYGPDDRDKFGNDLNNYLSYSQPVDRMERLFGREDEMNSISEALYSAGTHVFIFGDRGVGKSSLAASCAAQHQSSDNEHLHVLCGPDTKFYQTIDELSEKIIRAASDDSRYAVEHNVNLKVYSAKIKNEKREISIPKVESIFGAVEAIRMAAALHSQTPVIVIDEFDTIQDEKERKLFANFIKDLGDAKVNVKLIFTGVASALHHMFGDHESSHRQIFSIGLKRLPWHARQEIVEYAVKGMGLSVDEKVTHTVAWISGGFPYYAHLITSSLLWTAYKHEEVITNIDMDIFQSGLSAAIDNISDHLAYTYDKATLGKSDDYTEILWATADSGVEIMYSRPIFDSYVAVNQEIHGAAPPEDKKPLPYNKFMTRLRNLKSENYGRILENYPGRKGMHIYRENILKGFIRMKAYEVGIELKGETHDSPKAITAMAKSRVVKGRNPFASKPIDPTRGVTFRGEKKK